MPSTGGGFSRPQVTKNVGIVPRKKSLFSVVSTCMKSVTIFMNDRSYCNDINELKFWNEMLKISVIGTMLAVIIKQRSSLKIR